jgi:hypothetical protein
MSRKQVCRSAEEGSAERGAGARLRDATAEPNIGRAKLFAEPYAHLPGRIPTSGAPPPPYGAPHCFYGDLTVKANMSGRHPTRPSQVASPSKAMGPLLDFIGRPACGMRPPAIAASRRRYSLHIPQFMKEAAK